MKLMSKTEIIHFYCYSKGDVWDGETKVHGGVDEIFDQNQYQSNNNPLSKSLPVPNTSSKKGK